MLERRLYNLKVSGGITEEGIVVGNVYDKYGAGNPIVKAIMRGYDKSRLL